MTVLPFFQWMESLSLSKIIQDGTWYHPIIQVIHLVALAVFAGAILIVDLRLLGTGLKNLPLARVARDAQPWLIGGLLMLLLTGIPQVMSLAMKQYYSDFFWWKMEILLVATIFTFTVRRVIISRDEAHLGGWGKIVGLVSIGLWTSVAVFARLIGLLS